MRVALGPKIHQRADNAAPEEHDAEHKDHALDHRDP